MPDRVCNEFSRTVHAGGAGAVQRLHLLGRVGGVAAEKQAHLAEPAVVNKHTS